MISNDEVLEMSLPVFPSERRTLKEQLLQMVVDIETKAETSR